MDKKVRYIVPFGNKEDPCGIPVITPPVPLKSHFCHVAFSGLWKEAEKRLSEADEVVVFGYSCPQTDLESVALMRRAFRWEDRCPRFCVIDPNPDISARYARLIGPIPLHYYKTVDSYFDEIETWEDRRRWAEENSDHSEAPVVLPKEWVDFVLYG